MNQLRASIVATLSLAASIASAQGATLSVEERLQKLEAEQTAMKQQLAERDAVIQELKRELAAQGGTTAQVAVTTPSVPTAAAATAVPTPATAAEQAQVAGDSPDSRQPTPRQVETWSVYDPGDGFLIGRSEFGELSISSYAMARYMDQHDSDGVFEDHLGNQRAVDTRSDIFSHRIMVFLKGWMGSEKLIYNITLWTVNTTDQDAIFANLGYQFSRKFSLYAGLTGNPRLARQHHGRRGMDPGSSPG